jgi:hypothetical protein
MGFEAFANEHRTNPDAWTSRQTHEAEPAFERSGNRRHSGGVNDARSSG